MLTDSSIETGRAVRPLISKALRSQVCAPRNVADSGTAVPRSVNLKSIFDGQRIAVAADLVGFFPDGLLKFVKGELALFQQRSLIRSRLSS